MLRGCCICKLSRVRQVSNVFLLYMAEISASLIGLFLVGVFFYIESGLRTLHGEREVFASYVRAGIRVTLIVFAIPLGVSLALVALEPIWSRWLFLILSVMLLAANYDTAVRIWAVWKITRSIPLLINELVSDAMALTLIVLPWILGGFHPTREDLTWAILLSYATGFLIIIATVMSAFDISGEWVEGHHDEGEAEKGVKEPR
jgi:hypothetical protein